MNTKRILSTLVWVVSLGLGFQWISPVELCQGIVEENNLYIPASVKGTGLNEEQFNQVLDAVQAVYEPIIARQGAKLQINRLWSNGTVNASATRSGNRYIVNMYGGLARHQTITPDGFALVACHEVGHHLGGSPKIGNGWFTGWASNEGQSDYFATLKCLRKVYNDTAANAEWASNQELDPYLVSECQKQFANEDDVNLCARTSMAGMSTAQLFQALRKETTAPMFNTPSNQVVSNTDDSHPGTQCRLDTYFQGSLCIADLDSELDNNNPSAGTCTRSNGYLTGIRPLCWYKP